MVEAEAGDGRESEPAERLPRRTKLVFGLGDHTINISLSALSLFYLFFLTEIAQLRPALASLVLLSGRAVDAFTDPLMGRLSDRTPWRGGRRRPYFLIGALPFGASFALLWYGLPAESQAAKLAFYSGMYVLYSVSSTVLAVPYMALLPELALDYQERTSLSTYRAAFAVVGTLVAAVGTQTIAQGFGGGAGGYARMGAVAGVWLALPWLAVYVTTFERPGFQRRAGVGFAEGLRTLSRHHAYRSLATLYLFARIAVDIVGAMLVFFFTYWLARPGDVKWTLGILMSTVVASLPVWLWLSGRADKRTIFIAGTAWWIVFQLALLAVGPDWPRAALFALAALVGVGYAVADMMPWAMLGDVIDEDELESGERREGVYAGFMTFLRKLGGAGGVAVAGLALEAAGFAGGRDEQTGSALLAIRILTALAPAFFLALAALVAVRYPISRRRHAGIAAQLRARRAAP